MAGHDEIVAAVDEIAALIQEPIENRAADLGITPSDLLAHVVAEVKAQLEAFGIDPDALVPPDE
jgi:methionyl-tRNA synthetase